MHTPFLPQFRARLAPMRARPPQRSAPRPRATLAQIEQQLAPALPPEFLAQSAAGDFSRERLWPRARTYWCWMWQILQGNTACREVVAQAQALRALQQEPPMDASSSAYTQARAKLDRPLVERAFAASGASAGHLAAAPAALQGRPVRVIDASSVRLWDNAALRAEYPPVTNQFECPNFPCLRFAALLALESGALLARATGDGQTSELRLLFSLAEHCHAGDVLLGDRMYGQFVVLHHFQARGVDLICRLNDRSRTVAFEAATQQLGEDDALFEWERPKQASKVLPEEAWAEVPPTMTVRVLRRQWRRPGFRTQELTLVTTLLDPELYPAEEIFAAYLRRWRLEMCLDDLKTTLNMEMLHCRSAALVELELVMFLTAHNLLRWLQGTAARQAGLPVERLSFKGALDQFRQWSQAATQVHGRGKERRKVALWGEFLRALGADVVPERPGRMEPRAVKKRSKYPRLTKNRHTYVERWSRNKRRRVARAKKAQASLI